MLKCYEAQVPVEQIGWLDWKCTYTFDNGVPEGTREEFCTSMTRIVWSSRSPPRSRRRAILELDLIPLIHSMELTRRELSTHLYSAQCWQHKTRV